MDGVLEEFGWPARAAAAGAGLALVLIIAQGVGRTPPSLLDLAAMLALAIGALVALTRVPMPNALRAALMLGLIVATLAAALRADVALVRPESFSRATQRSRDGQGAESAFEAERRRDARAAAGGGASLELTAIDGTGGWVAGAHAALDGRIAAGVVGAPGWRIEGEARPGAGGAIAIDWRIAGDAGERGCGRLSVSAASASAGYLALGDMLAAAVRRSITAGKPLCA